jgi:DNA-binding transcriptional LysR family regulator
VNALQSIEAFVRVAETLSFSRAARRLGVSRSVVTTRVKQLEDTITAPLFHRTTRNVTLTEIGETFYPECAALLQDSEDLLERMREMKGAPAGVLRVHVLPGFVHGQFVELIGAFQKKYPAIMLDLTVSDSIVDPVREGYDCALQIFNPVSDSLVARRLFPWRPVFCAHRDYLAERGAPSTPEALTSHRLGLYSRYPSGDVWNFAREGVEHSVELQPYLRTNSVFLLRDYACSGAGISCIPTLLAYDGLIDGTLEIVLPDYELASFWLCAVYPSARSVTQKLRVFLESLEAAPRAESPWDQVLIERGLLSTTPELR